MLFVCWATTDPAPPPKPTPPPQIVEIHPGIDLEMAKRLFGIATGEDDGRYGFDPNGPVSKLWVEDGKATGEWPALQDVWVYDDGRRYFRCENGRLYLAAGGKVSRVKA
jgi:hypothetical protein